MLTRGRLFGSWMLEGADVVDDGRVVDPVPFGDRPYGVLHYIPDGRMAVLIAHDRRVPIPDGRAGMGDAATLAAARSFTAYAGTFDVHDDRIVHHVETNSFPNDVDVDYVRLAVLDDDRLTLATPPDLPSDQRAMRLVWRRYVRAS